MLSVNLIFSKKVNKVEKVKYTYFSVSSSDFVKSA